MSAQVTNFERLFVIFASSMMVASGTYSSFGALGYRKEHDSTNINKLRLYRLSAATSLFLGVGVIISNFNFPNSMFLLFFMMWLLSIGLIFYTSDTSS
jgi:hypothetical protein